MKAIINLILALFLVSTTSMYGQVPPPAPAPPAPPVTQMPPAPPAPPHMEDVDHDKNYKITMQSSDSDSGESIYLSLKNKQDRYLANGRFPERFRNDLLNYIIDVMGAKRTQSSNFDQWVGGADPDAVYKITLKEKSILISLDKTIASSTLINKIGDLGIGLKSVLSEEDEEAEIDRLERDADRLRRDAERMQREADRIRERAQRESDRLMREADRAIQEADRRKDQSMRDADRAMRDADRLAQRADALAREADKAGILTAHKGGMDSTVREVLRKSSTYYDASNAQNRNGWTWPAFQQDLLLSLEGDNLKGEDNEFVFISDASGIYVNGTKMKKDTERAYRDLFKRHGFDISEHFTFYKLYDHIAVTNSDVDLENFFKELLKRGDIASLSKKVSFEINGDSVKKDGELLPVSALKEFNKLLASYNIIPVPGKVIEIVKDGSYVVGYRPSKNTLMGTWMMN